MVNGFQPSSCLLKHCGKETYVQGYGVPGNCKCSLFQAHTCARLHFAIGPQQWPYWSTTRCWYPKNDHQGRYPALSVPIQTCMLSPMNPIIAFILASSLLWNAINSSKLTYFEGLIKPHYCEHLLSPTYQLYHGNRLSTLWSLVFFNLVGANSAKVRAELK